MGEHARDVGSLLSDMATIDLPAGAEVFVVRSRQQDFLKDSYHLLPLLLRLLPLLLLLLLLQLLLLLLLTLLLITTATAAAPAPAPATATASAAPAPAAATTTASTATVLTYSKNDQATLCNQSNYCQSAL